MKHKVLVTGGMGFVGGRVAQLLGNHEDFEVVVGGRLAQGGLSWLPGAKTFEMNWQSIGNLALACNNIDTIVHLAGMNDFECLSNPMSALEVNVLNTARLLEAANVAGVRRIVYISTAHIYGENLFGDVDESTLPKPRHPYATSKRAAEDLVLGNANSNINSVVLRLSNGFGVPAHSAVNAWRLLVNDLCRQAVTLQGMTLKTTGLQRRDFITLSDVSLAVLHMIMLPEIKIGNGIFNVGSGSSLRVIDMVELIQKRCGVVLGCNPSINYSLNDQSKIQTDLQYKIDKLLNTGFRITGNPSLEIDGILQMCKMRFIGPN